MPMTGFTPSQHGFHFDNRFVNRIATLPGFGELETYGRCGGMAFAALDYYYAGLPVPSERDVDFPDGVPPDGHPLADYIYRRLLDSFLEPTAINFVAWTLHADHPTWFFKGVTGWTKEDEFTRLRSLIDQGRPVPLGLVSARNLADIGHNHQVVAYGYDYDEGTGEIRVYIYDNNHHDQDVTLSTGPGNPHVNASSGEEWRGFFVESYHPVQPTYETQAPPERNAQFVSHAVPAAMIGGATHPVSVTMRNTGRVAWTPEEAYRLGSQNPQDNTIWGLGRVDVPARVEPGAQATFTFNVTAPRGPGAPNLQWRMLQEGVEWFGEPTPNVSVTIEVPPTCQPIAQEIHAYEEEIRALQEELHTAGPGEKPFIIGQIRELRARIQEKQRELDRCVQAGSAAPPAISATDGRPADLAVLGDPR